MLSSDRNQWGTCDPFAAEGVAGKPICTLAFRRPRPSTEPPENPSYLHLGASGPHPRHDDDIDTLNWHSSNSWKLFKWHFLVRFEWRLLALPSCNPQLTRGAANVRIQGQTKFLWGGKMKKRVFSCFSGGSVTDWLTLNCAVPSETPSSRVDFRAGRWFQRDFNWSDN